jgi:hypothetical protein
LPKGGCCNKTENNNIAALPWSLEVTNSQEVDPRSESQKACIGLWNHSVYVKASGQLRDSIFGFWVVSAIGG